jgi:hypothetical protein
MGSPRRTLEKAVALIAAVRGALAHGVEHYDLEERRLRTVKEVLVALNRDGEIKLRDPSVEPGTIITTDYEVAR